MKKFGSDKRLQIVKSAPAKILKESYMTKSGQMKNRYVKNIKSKPVKYIIHSLN